MAGNTIKTSSFFCFQMNLSGSYSLFVRLVGWLVLWHIKSYLSEFLMQSWMSFFLSFRVFGLLTSFLLLYKQCFGRCVLRPSSGDSCRILPGTSNHVLYLIHGVACFDTVNHNPVQVLSIPELLFAGSHD